MILPWLIWGLLISAGVICISFTRRWRKGRAAQVDLIAGIAALPRRYLVDVHHVVERRPGAARMHMFVAGGLAGGSALLLCGVLPFLSESRMYWALVSLLFAIGLFGTMLVRKRRAPATPSFLSRGKFLWLPVALALYTAGALLASVTQMLGMGTLSACGTALAAAGGAALLVQLANGPMRHAFAGATTLVAHARPARFGGGRDTALIPLDLTQERLSVLIPSDFGWNTLASFDACIECGRCEQMCPAFAAGQRLNPKALVQGLAIAARGGDIAQSYSGSAAPNAPETAGHGGMDAPVIGDAAMIHPDTLWACTTCRACVEECPMMIEHVDAVIDLRRGQTLMLGALPEGAARAMRQLRDTADPGGRPVSQRANALAASHVRVLEEGGETDILLWLGDGAFDLRYGRTLRALVQLMQHAGLDFAILGAAEPDCGDLARRLGDEATFRMMAEEVVSTLSTRRFRRIVTADPHALNALRNEYPAFGGNWQVQHHSGLLDELVRDGRLVVEKRQQAAVAWHDPCYLGRYNGEIEAPRRLLDAVCVTRVEMERHGRRSMCCGGGGGNPVSDIDAERRIPDIRMDHARAVQAEIVAVGCPGCTAMLEGVTGPRPEVLDVAELVLAALVHS